MATAFDNHHDPHAETGVLPGSGIKPPRNRTKAYVTKSLRDGSTVVRKDFSRCSPLLQLLYGRPTLRREARAYERLKGIEGIPECYGLEGRDCLVIEYIHGRPLDRFKPGELEAEVFDRLESVVAHAHARGVAFSDLHASNVIITGSRQVFFIDFAFSVFAADSSRPGLLVRLFMELDRHAAQRMRAHYLRLPAPVPAGLLGLLYRLGRMLKAVHKRIKRKFYPETKYAHSRCGR